MTDNRTGKVWRVVGVIALGGATTAVGVVVAYSLYDRAMLSWSDVTIFTIPVLIGVMVVALVAFVTLALVRNSRAFVSLVAGFLGLAVGFTGGVVGPGILGEQAIWTKSPESALYDLEVEFADIPASIIAQVNNPLEG